MGLCQQQDKVETPLFMSIASPGYWLQGSDNERVGWREQREGKDRRKERRREQGGWAKLSVLEHSGHLMKMK